MVLNVGEGNGSARLLLRLVLAVLPACDPDRLAGSFSPPYRGPFLEYLRTAGAWGSFPSAARSARIAAILWISLVLVIGLLVGAETVREEVVAGVNEVVAWVWPSFR
jgi:hypothetical protein